MDFLNEIIGYRNKLRTTIDKIDLGQINHFAQILLRHYHNGSHIFIFGNGGSGATASHVVCDFNKGVCSGLDKKFRFLSLNDNLPSILAYSNDMSYADIFYLQLKNFLTPQDLVIGISGSGNSGNVFKAIEYAQQIGADTFALCGFNGGRLKEITENQCIHVQVQDMQVVEDCHSVIFHMLMQVLYKKLRDKGNIDKTVLLLHKVNEACKKIMVGKA